MVQNFFIGWMSKACMSFQHIVWNGNGIKLSCSSTTESQTIQLQGLRQSIMAAMHRKLTAIRQVVYSHYCIFATTAKSC